MVSIRLMGGKLLIAFSSIIFGAAIKILEAINFPKIGP